MVYKRFSFKLFFRVALILINLIILATTITYESKFFSSIVSGIILLVQLYDIVRFINISNRQLARFIEAVKHSDLTISDNNDALGESFKELNQSFKEVLKAISIAKIEKEAQYQYLKLIIDHIETGIIAIDKDSNITLFNSSALTIPGIEEYSSFEKLTLKNPELAKIIGTIEPEESKLFEYKDSNKSIALTIRASRVKVMNKDLKLITFSNIASEIEQKEIEAWHRLIRTMAHEIMNSVTPISSLTETCLMLLEDGEGNQKSLSSVTENQIASLRSGLKTIEKRSVGLFNFVNDYRKLTKIPVPEKHHLILKTFLENIRILMQAEVTKSNINLIIDIADDNLSMLADSNLIEQVIINLIKNSIEALANTVNPVIEIKARQLNSELFLEVKDNGVGIQKEIYDSIFIPFFTTKKSGSGIGLSLSRQIMKLHDGNLTFESEPGVRTIFRLQFKA